MELRDLGLIPYRDAWALQEAAHAAALAGGPEALFLLEHAPVITFGRRAADSAKNLLASADRLAAMGVEVVESDRGGDITFHGPGQLVAYPIVRLTDRRLSVGAFVHGLEAVVIAALGSVGVTGVTDPSAPGVWVAPVAAGRRPADAFEVHAAPPGIAPLAKVCALGVRIKRGVSLHGIALNVTTALAYFDLINPCGLSRPVTSLARVLGGRAPAMADVKAAVAREMRARFG